MRHLFPTRGRSALFLAAALAFGSASSLAALADDQSDGNGPPPSVARISVADGDVGVKQGGNNEQVAAAVNAPVEAGDYVSTGSDGRAEIQLDPSNVVRTARDTQIRFTTLDGANDTVQLAQGTLELRVFQADNDHPTVQTPSADIVPDEAGAYLVSVDDNGMTSVTVRSGSLDVNTPQGSQTLDPGRTMQITGSSDNPQYQYVDEVGATDFDNWADNRDQELADAGAYQNVNGDMLGAPDLDQYGQWQNVSGYGEVWQPNDVAPGWSPYSAGNWSYEPYYGWTWISSEPWGWAPYHYGRWAFVGSNWFWVPGPRYVAPVYSPALVAFFGFGGGGGVRIGLGFGFGNIGWLPLAPGEVCHPWWGGGRTVVFNNTTIINNYRNAGHGLVGLPVTGWQHGDFNHITRLSPTEVGGARVIGGRLPIAATRENYRFTNRTVGTSISKPMYTRFNTIHPIGATRSYQGSTFQHSAYQRQGYAAPRSGFTHSGYAGANTTWQHFGAQRSGQSVAPRTGAVGSYNSWQHFSATNRPQYSQQYQRSQYSQQYQRPQYSQQYQRPQYSQQYQRPQYSQRYQRPQYSQQYQRPQYSQQYQRPQYSQQYQRPQQSYSRPSYQPQQRSYQAPQRSYSRPQPQPRGSANPHGRPPM